jgi:hypothetical protein
MSKPEPAAGAAGKNGEKTGEKAESRAWQEKATYLVSEKESFGKANRNQKEG